MIQPGPQGEAQQKPGRDQKIYRQTSPTRNELCSARLACDSCCGDWGRIGLIWPFGWESHRQRNVGQSSAKNRLIVVFGRSSECWDSCLHARGNACFNTSGLAPRLEARHDHTIPTGRVTTPDANASSVSSPCKGAWLATWRSNFLPIISIPASMELVDVPRLDP